MMAFYRVIYAGLQTIVLLLYPYLNSKLKKWVLLRFEFTKQQREKTLPTLHQPFWFHASSGEIEYVKSVIRELKKRAPDSQVLVTYSSGSAEALFGNIQKEVDCFIALPWDRISLIQQMLTWAQPRALIFSRTDLWPELIEQASLMKIPIAVVSFFPRWSKINRWWTLRLLKKFNLISCVNVDSKNQIEKFLNDSIQKNSSLQVTAQVTADGDTRFDQVFARLAQPSRLPLNVAPNSRWIVFGSTWPEDEKEIAPILSDIIDLGYQIIWAPHETNSMHINSLSSFFEKQRIPFQTLSSYLENLDTKNTPEIFAESILLIDRIGYLADAYRLAEMAFVGGSFKEKVHSVMEPLCCGAIVLVGPHYHNNPEALQFIDLKTPSVISVVQDSSSFLTVIKKLQTRNQAEQKAQILDLMKKQTLASQKIVDWLITIQKNAQF